MILLEGLQMSSLCYPFTDLDNLDILERPFQEMRIN